MEHQLSLRLPASLAKKLDEAAIRMRRKRSEVARLALEQFLDTDIEFRPIRTRARPFGNSRKWPARPW